MERGVDRRQPAALAVADEVHRPVADLVDARGDLGEVVGDRRVLRGLRRADPVHRVQPVQADRADRPHLALLRAEVDDAGVVAGLRRQHEGRHHVRRRRRREVAQARQRRAPDGRVPGRPPRGPALGHDLPPAHPVDGHVQRRSGFGDRAGPVVGHAPHRGAGRLDSGIQTATRDRRNAARGRNGNIHVPVTHIHNLPTSQDARRTAIVTGAASGIGKAITERLAKDGFSVLAVDLKPADDGPGEPFAADLTTREGNKAAVDAALERFGRIDAIVPNAGFQHVAPVAEFPEDRWDALLSILLTSPFLLAKYAWKPLVDAGDGRIVVIASAHALAASPFKAGYVSAKHGVMGLVKTLALEGAPHGILATAVCPGFVRTPLVEAQIADQAKAHGLPEERVLEEVIVAPHAVKRLIEPEEVADVVAFLVGPGGRSFTGAPVTMDMGWTAR